MTDKLERAKKIRQRSLETFQKMIELCTCAFPIDTYRNRHEHSSDCPWGPEWERLTKEREDARIEDKFR